MQHQTTIGKYTAYFAPGAFTSGHVYFEHNTRGEEDCWCVHIKSGKAYDYESGEPTKEMIKWLNNRGVTTSSIGY